MNKTLTDQQVHDAIKSAEHEVSRMTPFSSMEERRFAFCRALLAAQQPEPKLAQAIHYPECWDTVAYPTVESALREVYVAFRCQQCEQPEPCAEVTELRAEIERLNAIINTPHADDFLKAVSIEAEHQRQRWSSEHDAGKTPADWFWLVGYLAGKALHAAVACDAKKAEHHIITTSAACANWHLSIFGKTNMRPGIDGARAGEGR
ncbi:hypothetical protein [Burkholderia sp. AU15512]|uniref:hypothetical protein n=1 Tax=Burkholderia sp. AU15512 TaxID=2015345 RepID=UPI0015C5D700|nr:hypothetical protein [Burkholderia sp. AU15512]